MHPFPLRSAVLASSLFTLFATHAARADVPPPPAWCAEKPKGAPPNDGNFQLATTSTDVGVALENIVGVGCNFSYDRAQQAPAIEAARQRWMKNLELSDEDWPEAIDYVLAQHGYVGNYKPHDADARTTPIEQFAWIPITGDRSGEGFPALAVDLLGARLTEEGRLAYLGSCLSSDNPVDWAMCADDLAHPIDAAKLNAELRADHDSDGYVKFGVRLTAYAVRQKLAEHAEQVRAISAADPAYARLFEIAAKARTDWAKFAASNGDVLAVVDDLTLASESQSRKAGANCIDRVWPLWKSSIAALGAKSFPGKRADESTDKMLSTVLDDPRGDLAVAAMEMCAPDFLPDAQPDRLRRRGPRTAALVAMLGAGLKLDDAKARLHFPRPNYRPEGVAEPEPMQSGKGQGTVASVKANGDDMKIAFKHEHYAYVGCTEWKDNDRIQRIFPDGRVQYHSDCVRRGTITGISGDPDVAIRSRYAADVKPGMFVDIDHGVVIIGYASATAKLPNMIFGVAVK